MARPSKRTIGLVAGLGLVGWVLGFGVDRVAAGFLALPDDAALARPDFDPAALAVADAGDDAAYDDGALDDGPGAAPALGGPRGGSKKTFTRPIIERSIFDSSKVGIAPTGGSDTDDGPDVLSDLDATLLATVVAVPAEYSSALIMLGKGDSGAAQGFGIGDNLLGAGTIVEITPRRVVIERPDGSREFISMDDRTDAPAREPKGALTKGSGEETGVEKAGDNKFIVDAELVESALENPEKLASQVRVAPHKGSDGEIDGYRLSGIRRKSLFRKLGIKNGDIVHSVNGQPLTSMSAAMQAYESLQNDKNFSFEVTRRNKRQTFEYEIR